MTTFHLRTGVRLPPIAGAMTAAATFRFLAAAATLATLHGPLTGVTGVATSFYVSLDGPAPTGGITINVTAPGATLSPSTLTWAAGDSTSKYFTVATAADGPTSVSIAVSVGTGVSAAGTPISFVTSTSSVPELVQYLTSDGGAADGTVSGSPNNYCGPTRDFWYRRMGIAWKRTNLLGNWLDSANVTEGASAYGTSGTAATVGQTLSISVTALVHKWLRTGFNRGFYLSARGTLWPLTLYGRTDVTSGNRPVLSITTTVSSYTLPCAANACWSTSSAYASGSASQWALLSGSQPAILRFDLSGVEGDVTAATLSFVIAAFDTGHTGHVVDAFEADPPFLIHPLRVPTIERGVADGYADFPAWSASSDASKLFADDFAVPGSFDSGFTPPAVRTADTDAGTTYATGVISSGAQGSMDVRKDVMLGTGAGGAPNVIYDHLFAKYRWRMKYDFGTTNNDAIKIPAMGVQFGWWNNFSAQWQQTTGNGGSIGTGLKKNAFSTGNVGVFDNFEYEGHSIRILTGTAATGLDSDSYPGYYGVGVYPYNLDQGGINPVGEPWPNVVIRQGEWYEIEQELRQNTTSGTQDGLGNYATANADGVLRFWVNGWKVYEKTTFRWRRHLEMGVQGWWGDVYHGGQTTAPHDMHYDIDQVSISTSYMGPTRKALPTYVPAAGRAVTLVKGGGVLLNNYRDSIAPYYDDYNSVSSIFAFSGATASIDLNTHGGLIICADGGHAGTHHNGASAISFGVSTISFIALEDGTPYFGTATDTDTQHKNGYWQGSGFTAYNECDATWGDPLAAYDSRPAAPSSHSYRMNEDVAHFYGGEPQGRWIRTGHKYWTADQSTNIGGIHRHERRNGAGKTGNRWARSAISAISPSSLGASGQAFCKFVPPQRRIYLFTHTDNVPVWMNIDTGLFAAGTGTGFPFASQQSDFSGGTLLYIPERELLVALTRLNISGDGVATGVAELRAHWMRVRPSDTNPTLGGTATLSSTVNLEYVGPSYTNSDRVWTHADWCPPLQQIIIGCTLRAGVIDTAAYLALTIPATLTDPWPITRVPFGGGTTVAWNNNSWQTFKWFESLRSFAYYHAVTRSDTGYHGSGGGSDQITFFRPAGT